MSVNYRGNDTYKTKLGACVSILTYILIMLNVLGRVEAFLDGSKQDEKSSTSVVDLLKADAFNLQENQFELSFVLLEKIPENIGRLVANQLFG